MGIRVLRQHPLALGAAEIQTPDNPSAEAHLGECLDPCSAAGRGVLPLSGSRYTIILTGDCRRYRDALSDLAIHFLDKIKVMVIKDIEREDIEFVCKTLGCRPIASLDHFLPEHLASADLVEEVQTGANKFVKVTGIQNPGRTVTILVRGSNKLVLEEAERSLHDALCVIRCLVKQRALIAGGGAPETEVCIRLSELAQSVTGVEAYCFRSFANALEVIPFTLAENAGLNPIATVTELRNRHAEGEVNAGINVRRGEISNILEENVVQPLLVSTSAINLASETVRSILKIDDIVSITVAGCSTSCDF
ncbi:hypothetical protein PR048_022762 [Dryococelus australis]|uniref:T-complex protein 1 subunit delta n=1 Tax=Dryococelus australis TaxID=614101 RepID=A0ABQ9GS71_9NEOP|nr:hypothetical protein PR048_022762 [Dryococelus australis]